MLTAILETIATYEKITGTKPIGITLELEQYYSLIGDCIKQNIEFPDDTYAGFELYGVWIDWEDIEGYLKQ